MRQARLTIIETVVHQLPEEQPTAVEAKYGCELETNEQPFGPRHFTATPEWQPLPVGWLEGQECSMLHLENREGQTRQIVPTAAERAATAALVVEIAFATTQPWADPDPTPAHLLLPGRTERYCPANLASIHVRCPGGKARLTITLFPR